MLKLISCATGLVLLAGASTAQMFDNLSETDRAALHSEIRNYLLANPDIVFDLVDLVKEQEAEQRAKADLLLVAEHADDIFEDGYSFVGGNPEGSVTMVEFIDYQCSYCKRAHSEVKSLIAADGDIRYVVKELPILGPASLLAARASTAVLMTQGADIYEAFNDTLMGFQGQLNEPIIKGLARRSGVDVDLMLATMDSEDVTERLADTRRLADTLEISGTPAFVLGTRMIRGYVQQDTMTAVVAAERKGL